MWTVSCLEQVELRNKIFCAFWFLCCTHGYLTQQFGKIRHILSLHYVIGSCYLTGKKVFIFHIHLGNCCNISYWLYLVEMSKSEKYTSLLLYQECPLESYWAKLVSGATPLFRSALKYARFYGSHYAATQSERYSACLKMWIIQFQDKDGFFSLTRSSDNSLQKIACSFFTSDI